MSTSTKELSRMLLVIGILASRMADAQSSSQYADMGLAVWSAFECSALAGKSNNSREQERLFKYGYARGVDFIDALQAGKVERADLSATLPIGLVLRLQGPTADFMLGRIFEGAVESGLEGVFGNGEQFNSEETQIALAQSKFREQNCKLIGS